MNPRAIDTPVLTGLEQELVLALELLIERLELEDVIDGALLRYANRVLDKAMGRQS